MTWYRVVLDGYVFNFQVNSAEDALACARDILFQQNNVFADDSQAKVWDLNMPEGNAPGDDAAIMLTDIVLEGDLSLSMRSRAMRVLHKMDACISEM